MAKHESADQIQTSLANKGVVCTPVRVIPINCVWDGDNRLQVLCKPCVVWNLISEFKYQHRNDGWLYGDLLFMTSYGGSDPHKTCLRQAMTLRKDVHKQLHHENYHALAYCYWWYSIQAGAA